MLTSSKHSDKSTKVIKPNEHETMLKESLLQDKDKQTQEKKKKTKILVRHI
jgi:hypothetical protein